MKSDPDRTERFDDLPWLADRVDPEVTRSAEPPTMDSTEPLRPWTGADDDDPDTLRERIAPEPRPLPSALEEPEAEGSESSGVHDAGTRRVEVDPTLVERARKPSASPIPPKGPERETQKIASAAAEPLYPQEDTRRLPPGSVEALLEEAASDSETREVPELSEAARAAELAAREAAAEAADDEVEDPDIDTVRTRRLPPVTDPEAVLATVDGGSDEGAGSREAETATDEAEAPADEVGAAVEGGDAVTGLHGPSVERPAALSPPSAPAPVAKPPSSPLPAKKPPAAPAPVPKPPPDPPPVGPPPPSSPAPASPSPPALTSPGPERAPSSEGMVDDSVVPLTRVKESASAGGSPAPRASRRLSLPVALVVSGLALVAGTGIGVGVTMWHLGLFAETPSGAEGRGAEPLPVPAPGSFQPVPEPAPSVAPPALGAPSSTADPSPAESDGPPAEGTSDVTEVPSTGEGAATVPEEVVLPLSFRPGRPSPRVTDSDVLRRLATTMVDNPGTRAELIGFAAADERPSQERVERLATRRARRALEIMRGLGPSGRRFEARGATADDQVPPGTSGRAVVLRFLRR